LLLLLQKKNDHYSYHGQRNLVKNSSKQGRVDEEVLSSLQVFLLAS